MHEDRVSFGSSSIYYSWGGTGNKLLLCFHGYGESAASFAFLEGRLGGDFTILALDLPFHGGTEWNDGLFFDPQKLPNLIGKILARLPVQLPPDPPILQDAPFSRDRPIADDPLTLRDPAISYHRWWVLGYSMGGRVALSLLERVPGKIAKLILLAPDGLKLNRWYWIATQSRPGNRIFRWTMRQPAYFIFLLRIAYRLNLVNPGIYKFILNYIGDPRAREELYERWMVMRGFKPDIPAIRSLIRQYHTPVRLLYGRYDRIIRAHSGERFRKGIGTWCSLDILDTGHQLLQEKYLDRLIELLND